MAAVNVVFSGDDTRLAQAHERLLKDQEKLLEKYKGLANQSTKSAAEKQKEIEVQKKLMQLKKDEVAASKQAAAIIQANITPQEKFNAAVKEAIALKSKGALTTEQLQREYKRLKEELRGATGETKAAAVAEQKHNVERDHAKRLIDSLRTKTEQLADSQAELNRLYDAGHIDATQLATAQQRLEAKFKSTHKAADPLATSLKSVAISYGSIQGALALVNSLAQENNAIMEKSLTLTRGLAAAQSDTLKNMAGLSLMQTSSMMEGTVDAIIAKTGFAGRDQLTAALGGGISAGGSVEETISAVTASALINKNTPTDVATTAASAIDLAAASKITDAKRNLGFLLTMQKATRVDDQTKLAEAIAGSLGSVADANPGIDRETAMREGGALYAVLNQSVKDVDGSRSKTATIQLSTYLRELFKDVADDPMSLSGRLARVQSDPELRTKALKALPGEAEFKLPFENLLTANSDITKAFQTVLPDLQFSATPFNELVTALTTATETLGIADAGITAESNIEDFRKDSTIQARAEIDKIYKETIPLIRQGGLAGAGEFITEAIFSPIAGSIKDPEGLGNFVRGSFRERRQFIENKAGEDGFTKSEQSRVNLIDKQLKAIDQILARLEKAAPANMENVADKLNQAASNFNRNGSQAAQLQATTRGAE